MWHSHTEKEMTNNDIFPGGMMTMLDRRGTLRGDPVDHSAGGHEHETRLSRS